MRVLIHSAHTYRLDVVRVWNIYSCNIESQNLKRRRCNLIAGDGNGDGDDDEPAKRFGKVQKSL